MLFNSFVVSGLTLKTSIVTHEPLVLHCEHTLRSSKNTRCSWCFHCKSEEYQVTSYFHWISGYWHTQVVPGIKSWPQWVDAVSCGFWFGTNPAFDGCAAFTGLMPWKCFQLLRIAAAAVGEPCPASPSWVRDIFSWLCGMGRFSSAEAPPSSVKPSSGHLCALTLRLFQREGVVFSLDVGFPLLPKDRFLNCFCCVHAAVSLLWIPPTPATWFWTVELEDLAVPVHRCSQLRQTWHLRHLRHHQPCQHHVNRRRTSSFQTALLQTLCRTFSWGADKLRSLDTSEDFRFVKTERVVWCLTRITTVEKSLWPTIGDQIGDERLAFCAVEAAEREDQWPFCSSVLLLPHHFLLHTHL